MQPRNYRISIHKNYKKQAELLYRKMKLKGLRKIQIHRELNVSRVTIDHFFTTGDSHMQTYVAIRNAIEAYDPETKKFQYEASAI